MKNKNTNPSYTVIGEDKKASFAARLKTRLFSKKKWVLLLVAIVVLAIGGMEVYHYHQNHPKGSINVSTYPWPTTEKGTVKDRTNGMSNAQKAEYFYTIAFEYSNTNKPEDARAAVVASLQYQKTEKALLLAAGLAETRRDYAAAIQYYQDVINQLSSQSNPNLKIQAEQYQKRIDVLKKLQAKPGQGPPATPTKDPSKVSA